MADVYDMKLVTQHDGAEATIVIRRGGWSGRTLPLASDMPADMRAALVEWLGNPERVAAERAWEQGWDEHYREHERQRQEPDHPITRRNPYSVP